MPSHTHYHALTIGPIYTTLSKARKAREIWAASYLFSRFAMDIIRSLKEAGIKDEQFIIPFTPNIDRDYYSETGLYPDRLMFEGQEKDNELIKKAFEACLKGLNFSIQTQSYFRFLSVSQKKDSEFIKQEGVIKGLNKLLDSAECRNHIPPHGEDEIRGFLKHILNEPLYKGIFQNNRNFPSLVEIGTAGIRDIDEIQYNINVRNSFREEDDIWESLITDNTFKPHLKQYHKYVAIVNADGDRVGSLIAAMHKNGKVSEFAESLLEYATKATSIINSYQGKAIYVGGDDLLFFAPVVNKSNENIFDLVQKLDKAFAEVFEPYKVLLGEKADEFPCLSYGISITYYKYPLHEALNNSHDLLMEVKKDKYKTRNNINISLLKHSGQSLSAIINKNFDSEDGSYSQFKAILAQHIQGSNSVDSDKEANFLSGVMYKLDTYKSVIYAIANNPQALENFFENAFDETIHKSNRAYLNTVRDYIHAIWTDYASSTSDEDKLQKVYTTLRLVHFLNSTRLQDDK